MSRAAGRPRPSLGVESCFSILAAAMRALRPPRCGRRGFGTRRSSVLNGDWAMAQPVTARRAARAPVHADYARGYTAAPGPVSSSTSPACIGSPQCAQRRSAWLISPHAW